MKVKAVKRFKDLKANTMREHGDIFETDEERAEYLIGLEYVVKEESSKNVAAENDKAAKTK